MLPLNAARALIQNAEPEKAIDLLLSSLEDREDKNTLILLANRLNAWKDEEMKGFQPAVEKWNLIVQSLICQITELEIKEEGRSKKRAIRLEIEREILAVHEKMTSLSTPENRTSEALDALQRKHPGLYASLVQLAAAKVRLAAIWKNPKLDTGLANLLKDKQQELETRLQALSESLRGRQIGSNPANAPLLEALIRNNVEYALEHESKSRSRQTRKGLLFQRLASLEEKKRKALQAGALGLLGFSFGLAANGSVFGKGFDQDGYDARGYDPDGFDKNGFNENGINHLGFDRNGLAEGMSSLPNDWFFPAEEEFNLSE